MRLKRLIPDQLQPYINGNKLTKEDAIDLLIVASNALKQCHSQDYTCMDIQTAIGFSDCLQDEFTGIEENDGFINAELDLYEWSELAEYAAQLITRKTR